MSTPPADVNHRHDRRRAGIVQRHRFARQAYLFRAVRPASDRPAACTTSPTEARA
jgi:hypothetical protein